MTHRTRDDDGRRLPEPGPKKRKKRPNLIGNSPNRAVYYELMQAGWSSTSLSFYADHRFGERIAASTFRSYRAKRGWPARSTPAMIRDSVNERLPPGFDAQRDHDTIPDVFHERSELVRLQKLRVALAVADEIRSGELAQTTRLEIQTLSKLISEVQADLQLMGLLPTPAADGDGQEVGAVRDAPQVDAGAGPVVPEWAATQTFGDLVAGLGPGTEAGFARSLQELGLLSGNGQANGEVRNG